MAITLRTSITARFEDSVTGFKDSAGYGSVSITGSGANVAGNTQTVGTVDEVLPLGDVGTPGAIYIRNYSASIPLIWGSDGTNYPGRVRAGAQIHSDFNGAAVHVKGVGGSCFIEWRVFEA